MSDHTLPLFYLQPEVLQIPLTQGKVALVDPCDYDRLMEWKWRAHWSHHERWYVLGYNRLIGKKNVSLIHRVILDAKPGQVVDHVDGNGLNNTRANLRLVTAKENAWNRKRNVRNTSGFIGVTWHKKCGKWQAMIEIESKSVYLGLFSDPEDAARAYDEVALRVHGEFAYLNFRRIP